MFGNKKTPAPVARRPRRINDEGFRGMVFHRLRNGRMEVVEAPQRTRLSTRLVDRGIQQGWIRGVGERVETRPAGAPTTPWKTTPNAPRPHLFHHFDSLVVGKIHYKVTHQPDKYADPGDDKTPVTDDVYQRGNTRVDWFYELERIDG